MNKVIQITNLLPETHFKNCHRGRLYWSKGIAPCLNCKGGGQFRTEISMDKIKVVQIANICKGICNTANPIPGRIYYPKGCSPALNTCGGGGEHRCIYG